MIMSLGKNCERCTKSTPGKHTPPTVSYCKQLISVPVPGGLWSSGPAPGTMVKDTAEIEKQVMQLLSQEAAPNLKVTRADTGETPPSG